MQNKTYKICIVGGENTGKTTFIRKLCTGVYTEEYTPTLGVEVHPVQLKGIHFNCWDCAGMANFGGLRDGYYLQSDAFIVFVSTEKKTRKVLSEILDRGIVPPNTPCVFVWAKMEGRNTCPEWVEKLSQEKNIPFVGISTKENINTEEPFNILIQKLK